MHIELIVGGIVRHRSAKWAKHSFSALHPLLMLLCLFGVTGCGLVSYGGSDTSTNWYHSCDDDADCGQPLSCLCGMCSQPCAPEEGCPTLPGARCRTNGECEVQRSMCVALPDEDSSVTRGHDEDSSSGTKELPLVVSLAQCVLADERTASGQHGIEYECESGAHLATSCWDAGDPGDEVFCLCATAVPLSTLFAMQDLNEMFPSAQRASGDALLVRPSVWFESAPLDVAVGAASAACFGALLDPMQGHCIDDGATTIHQCQASRECAVSVDVSVGPAGTLRLGKQLECSPQDDSVRCSCGTAESIVPLEDFTADYCEAHLDECFQRTDDW